MTVHGTLKGGLYEKIYENALCIELAEMGLSFAQQEEFEVHYKNQFVGKLIPDLIVENKVIVDTKSTESINGNHISQMLSYLSITGLEIGLIINFKNQSLKFKRISKLKDYRKKSV